MRFTRRGMIVGLGSLAAAAVGLFSLASRANPYYSGPVSDHFDGVRFRDPHGAEPKSLVEVLRWYTSRSGEPWPERAPSPHRDTPPARVTGATLRLSYVGHASFLLQAAGCNVLIDPVWSERASPVAFAGPKRVNDPGIHFESLPKIDVVLVSHGHYDHLDVATLARLAERDRPRVLTPLGNDAVMTAHDPAIAAQAFDWHDRVDLAPGLAVTFVPLRHWSARGLFDRNKSLWAGFVIETPAGRIYHVADSGYGDGFRFREARERYGPFRLAILPIGAFEPRWFMRDQHMNPADAVQAMRDCGAELALAHHHGTFRLADEAIDRPAADLETACREAGLPRERFRVLAPGQVLEL